MKFLSRFAPGLLFVLFVLAGCAGSGGAGSGWVTLIEGEKGMENFARVGDANWRAEGGAIVADKGKGGFLVSKNTYKDFEMRAEFLPPPIPTAVFSSAPWTRTRSAR